MTAPSDQDVGLAKTMLARRNGLRNRMGFAVVYAVSFGPIAGWRVSLGWLAAYSILQAVEFWFFARDAVRSKAVNRTAAIVMLSGNSIIYGALGILSILSAGPWGVTCGGLFLAGAVLNTVVTNQRSQVAYIASMTPFGVYLLITASLAWLLSGATTTGVAIGAVGVLLVFSSTILWKAAADGLEAQRRSRAEADRQRQEAESLAAVKSTFIAMVSHELRTPISAILAGAEAIGRDPGAPATRSNAALIGEAGRMMGALLNDLLDLSKMEAGRMSVETIGFAPRALVADAVAFWRAEAERKGLALEVERAETLPDRAAGDPTRLRQILNNLFSNAIKFTEAGKITLSVGSVRDVDGWSVRLSVTDTGAGMTEAQLERLFIPFDQTQDSTARTHGGTGLGLVISRELARLMGGDLIVRSSAGRGSTFTLAVGLGEAEALVASEPAREVDVADVRVLVVDDHEVNRRAVALMVEPLGVALTTAASAAEALDLLFTTPFDVILMDIHMPGMGGCEAARVVRTTDGPNRDTPIIACTGSTTDADLEACRAAGMAGHVAKPIDAGALHAAIAAALEGEVEFEQGETVAA